MFFFFDDTPVTNNLNSTNLQYIKINGLFNRTNITLNFDNEVNVYIGENGLGKTTVLNCVYYVLKKRFSKLSEIVFDDISVKFKNIVKEYIITSADIRDYNNKKSRRGRLYDEPEMIKSVLEESLGTLSEELLDQENIEIVIRKIAYRTDVPISIIRQYVIQYLKNGRIEQTENKKGNYKKVDELSETIDKNINQKIIYLTTYRRIENDFSNLISTSDRFSSSSERLGAETDLLIQFGMADVDKAIKLFLTK